MKILRIVLLAGLAIAVLLGAYIAYVLLRPQGAEPAPPIAGAPPQMTSPIERGKYLATAADCTACHSIPTRKPFAGGYPFVLPFGTLYATNISSSKQYGIGAWSDDDFVKAVREGVSPRVGHLYPAMPYTSYVQMSRDDILAIKAYLMSLPPADQPNIENEIPFPFNQRWGLTFWNLFFLDNQRFKPNPKQSDEWNRGGYYVDALGHCGECHTPRNIGFAMKNKSEYLAGALVGWYAPNLTSDKISGLGDWSDEQLTQYLSKGHAPGRSTASGGMAEAVENSLQYLQPQDIKAMVTYLRSVKPIANAPETEVSLKPEGAMAASATLPAAVGAAKDNALGRDIFARECAGCHQWNGQGRQTPYANLVGTRSVNDARGHSVVQAILKGTSLRIGEEEFVMPGFAQTLSDTDIAAVANYVIGQFGDKTGKVSASMVSGARNP